MIDTDRMNGRFEFCLEKKDGGARKGRLKTPRGDIRTPAFMPVGTAGTVKAMYMEQVKQTGADVILGNTYHLMLRPSAERIARLGGLHRFCGWEYPILTDSGGFQVMSLAKLRQVEEKGVTFKSHVDGGMYEMSPERSVEIQSLLGSDILMQLDECIALPAEEKKIRRAMELSLRWAERSKIAFEKEEGCGGKALFGIVQGGDCEALRVESARRLVEMEMQGYSIGGLAVGETQETMLRMLEVTCGELPSDKPRYLMGVGTPDDMLEGIRRGVDMFDCVLPTRGGRHGTAYTRFGKINLRNACHREDGMPLDEASGCAAARDYSRAYLHHLVRADEPLGGMLLSWSNLAYYQDLMRGAREAIEAGRYGEFVAGVKAGWGACA